jgi:hypothetical protein
MNERRPSRAACEIDDLNDPASYWKPDGLAQLCLPP